MIKDDYRATLKGAVALAVALGVSACGRPGGTVTPPPPPISPLPKGVSLDQGPQWDDAKRAAFYTQDQGSRIMPLAWFKALRQSDGTPFAADALARFGYLPNPNSLVGLPVGFTTGSWQKTDYVGMTCAACHTRQIRVGSNYYRIDGGPALSDLQGLFAEMDAAVQSVLASDANFTAFAADVLGKGAPADTVAQLHADVTAWAGPYHTLIAKALPTGQAWGVGRADAIGMIFNRLGGLDIGPSPDHVIATNIQRADAPARYPFLWNAVIQDRTQWPGFAPNGNDLLGLARNLGEVYGVSGKFYPEPRAGWVGGIDYVNADTVNSANFKGLDKLEQMTRRIGEPAWPWKVSEGLVQQGKGLFNRPDQNGQSCASCHGIVTQWPGPFLPATWKTPKSDVGTDSREYATLEWQGASGVMEGSYILLPIKRIKHRDSLENILTTAVAGAIVQKAGLGQDPFSTSLSLIANDPEKNEAMVADSTVPPPPTTAKFEYESRVLEGIWAAAPYLHNGSVPTLHDLLQPCDKRPASFDVGIDYDTDNVGLAAHQSGPIKSTTTTTGLPGARDTGNYRCGHEGVGFGTNWKDPEKQALIEYLKTL